MFPENPYVNGPDGRPRFAVDAEIAHDETRRRAHARREALREEGCWLRRSADALKIARAS